MSSAGEDTREIWSVSRFVGMSRDLLVDAMPFVWVRGEISGFSAPSSGHWYFDLKDEHALVPVAMFSRANSQVPFEVEAGMEIIVGGEVTIYPVRGKFQIVAEMLEPVGWGAMQLAFEQLRARLAEEGLFDADRKRPLPLLPTTIGVVTSPTGAAWRDMCRVWHNNQVPIRAVLSPARVQGAGAAEQIVAAIERLNANGEADVIIVGRGGGSREDLWAFNEEPVARAIAASAIPVVSAVGHEIDQTIADFVADRLSATPTAAAELVAASRKTLVARLDSAWRRTEAEIAQRLLRSRSRLQEPRLQRNLRQPARLLQVYRQRLDDTFAPLRRQIDRRLARHRQTLDGAARLLSARNPAALALRRRQRADNAARRVENAAKTVLADRKARLQAAVARIDALSPLAVLGRGYSICERAEDDRIVRRGADVAPGEAVRVRLARDVIDCTVDAVREGTEGRGV